MSKLGTALAIPIGFAVVRSLTKEIKDEPAPKPVVPQGFTLGPAAPKMDFNLFPTIKLTPEQVAAPIPTAQEQAYTRERLLAPSGTPEQAALIAQAYRPGTFTPLGYRKGETTDDLLRRLFNNPK